MPALIYLILNHPSSLANGNVPSNGRIRFKFEKIYPKNGLAVACFDTAIITDDPALSGHQVSIRGYFDVDFAPHFKFDNVFTLFVQ